MEATESANREQKPYRAEYAPTSRAKCKKCDSSIEKDSLKMSYMVRSRFHDGFDAKSHHLECFFKIKRPKSVADIAHYEKLKYEDQKLLEKAVETNGASVLGQDAGNVDDTSESKKKKSSSKGSKRKLANGSACNYDDFKVEPAKSNRSSCQLCEEKIEKGTLRICKLDYDASDAPAWSNGPLPRWFHVGCFNNGRASLEFNGVVERIPGFEDLEEDEQKQLKKAIKPIKGDKDIKNGDSTQADIPNKKAKKELDDASNEEKAARLKEEKLLKKQSDKYFALKEIVGKMKKADVVEMMQAMDQKNNFTKTSPLVDLATDILLFGPLNKCRKCGGKYILRGSAYICTGGTEWASCDEETRDPPRGPPQIPEEIVEKYPYFKKEYKFKPGKRIFPATFVRAIEQKDSEINPKLNPLAPLEGLIIGVSQWKNIKPEREKIESKVKSLGGVIQTTIDKSLFVLLGSQKEIDKPSVKIETAIASKIPVVSPDFLFKVKKPEDVPKFLKECLLSEWDGQFEQRFASLNVRQLKEKIKNKSSASNPSNIYKSSAQAKSQTLVIKDGNAVDPSSGLQHTGRIYRRGNSIYSVVLNCVDVEKDKNSFYKIQIIEHEGKKKLYTLFRSWGRIGCGVGGETQADYKDPEKAIGEFTKLYEDRTANLWSEREHFVKKHNKYFPVEIDYGTNGENNDQEELHYSANSKLSKEVQQLISFIFDIGRMRQAMLEFELDTTKMPLGRLSKVHILEAMSVLKELEAAISPEDDVKPNKKEIIGLTNKLYSHIPHSFGDGKVKLISSTKEIEEKNEMLSALAEIEIAYDMCSHIDNKSDIQPVDQYYLKLNCGMTALSKESPEYGMIFEYAKISHAITHNNYQLVIEDIFSVSRQEDIDRFEKFKNLDRSLIWHGSRTTNYAGILSHGLRIAPSEAPVTGYMFGKGIYFADMVSKAANYCMANPENDTGLVVLCEVALGNMHKVMASEPEFPKGIPDNCDSVMGVGKTTTEPSTYRTIEEGLVVPMGKGIPNKGIKSQLLYNEFIVYSEAQAKIRYIVKTKFEFRR